MLILTIVMAVFCCLSDISLKLFLRDWRDSYVVTGVLTALPEDPNWIPSAPVEAHNRL